MKAKILNLKPTQFAVGMDEVEFRVKEMSKMIGSEMHKYLLDHKVPVVRGPEGLYLIDRHHLVRALWEMNYHHVPIVVKGDLRKSKSFWHEMLLNNWVYFTNQFGVHHPLPVDLPRDIRCMADNQWRSLAWKVRLKGGFEKNTMPFAEFHWAEFLRGEMMPIYGPDDVKTALILCKIRAGHLPGYKHGK